MKKIDRNGFTLMEVLIFSAIFGIVIGAIYMMYSSSHTTFTRGQNRIDLQQNGRVAMEMMAREIRTAGYDPSDAIGTLGTMAIETANANTITFVADVDGDNGGTASPDTDRVTFRLDATTSQLIRDFSFWSDAASNFGAVSSSVLADGVNALTFTYFDGSDAAPGGNADIRRITIQLTTQTDETLHGTGTQQASFPLSMDVRLRNLQ